VSYANLLARTRALRRLVEGSARKDPFPQSIDLNLTTRCNGRCNHCSFWRIPGKDLPTALALDLFDSLAGHLSPGTKVNILGGEPTLHPDLPILLRRCEELGFQAVLTTNGRLLADPDLAAVLLRSPPSMVVVSLDGLETVNDRLRGPGSFRLALAALTNLFRLAPSTTRVVQALVAGPTHPYLDELATLLERDALAQALTLQVLCPDFALPHVRGWWRSHPLWPEDPSAVGLSLDRLAASRKDRLPVLALSSGQLIAWKKYFLDPEGFERLGPGCGLAGQHLDCGPDGGLRLCPHHPSIGRLGEAPLHEMLTNPRAETVRRAMASCDVVCNFLVNCRYELLHHRKSS